MTTALRLTRSMLALPQLEKRYGLDDETMRLQPATKVFCKTSEARAAR